MAARQTAATCLSQAGTKRSCHHGATTSGHDEATTRTGSSQRDDALTLDRRPTCMIEE